jgi:DNA polymerase-3 subunit delta
MQVQFRDLSAQLQKKSLAPLWFITGSEQLLMVEAADAIRSAARAAGYTEREVLNASALWNWSLLIESCQAMSLFAEKRIVELRLASPKPGKQGSEVLQTVSEMARTGGLENTILIVSIPFDWSIEKLAWYKKLTSIAATVRCEPVTAKELPGWFQSRFKLQGQTAEPMALKLLSERCEGNLLAAKQELLKLSYAYPAGTEITEQMIRDSVSDVSRFDAEALLQAALLGDAAKGLKVLEKLRDEGQNVLAFSWMITDEIRKASQVRSLMDAGRTPQDALRAAAVWGPAASARIRALARRHSAVKLASALMLCADIDKIAKGLTVKTRSGDVWNEMASLVAFVARG